MGCRVAVDRLFMVKGEQPRARGTGSSNPAFSRSESRANLRRVPWRCHRITVMGQARKA
jgi:hypothetical protein